MPFSNKIHTLITLGAIVLLGSFSTSAKAVNSKDSFYSTKSIILYKTSSSVELQGVNGLVMLPRYEKRLLESSPIITFNEPNINKRDSVIQHLSKKYELKKELHELSKKLGVDLSDESKIDLFREVASWMGTRYRRGGMSEKGIDCSGFANVIYRNVFDKGLPRVSGEIARNLDESLPVEDIEPGDLVFFSTYGKKHINHVGVYLGEGKFAHASCKQGVIVSSLSEGYYNKNWKKAGKIN